MMKKTIFVLFLTVFLVPGVFAQSTGTANVPMVSGFEDVETYRAQLLDFGQTIAPEDAPSSSPAISISIPTGYGSSWRNAFVGFNMVNDVRYDTYVDGAASAGIGFGNPNKYVGGSISASFYDLFGKPLQRGGVNLHIWRMLPYHFGISVGANDLLTWGVDGFRLTSYYGALSKAFRLSQGKAMQALYLTAGIGNGHFNSESKVQTNLINNENKGWNPFFGAALQILRPVSLIANYNGQNLDAGISVAPLRKHGLVLTAAAVDIVDSWAGDGVRFSFNLGYGFKF